MEECNFDTIFGKFEGHKIYANRKVAEKIEIQTRYAAELQNVDVRQDQRYLAYMWRPSRVPSVSRVVSGYITAIKIVI